MKKILLLSLISLFCFSANAQSDDDISGVKNACMGYLDGFYNGDTSKIIDNIRPTLYKYGYWKDKNTGTYEGSQMTFKEAVAYARNVSEKKNFPSPDAPKEVEVLNVMNHVACAKVNAWWGSDYILLSKVDDKWMIEQVLWEGPPSK